MHCWERQDGASRALVGRRFQSPSGCFWLSQGTTPRDQERIQAPSNSLKVFQYQRLKIRNDEVSFNLLQTYSKTYTPSVPSDLSSGILKLLQVQSGSGTVRGQVTPFRKEYPGGHSHTRHRTRGRPVYRAAGGGASQFTRLGRRPAGPPETVPKRSRS